MLAHCWALRNQPVPAPVVCVGVGVVPRLSWTVCQVVAGGLDGRGFCELDSGREHLRWPPCLLGWVAVLATALYQGSSLLVFVVFVECL